MNTIKLHWTGLIAITTVCCLLGCRRQDIQQAPQETPRTFVTLGQLQRHTFQNHLSVKGVVHAIDSAVISAKNNGTIENFNLTEGDSAKSGDVLFCLDPHNLETLVSLRQNEIYAKQAILDCLQISAQTAELTHNQLQRDFERERKLREANVNSQAVLEAAETAYLKADLEIQSIQTKIVQADAELKQSQNLLVIAQQDLSNAMVEAPYDCVVTERYVQPHEYVTVGQKIIKIENQSRFEIVCHLAGDYYDKVAVGRTRVELYAKGVSLGSSLITYKAPAFDENAETFKIKVSVPNNSGLIGGMPCEINFILLEKEVWALPKSALQIRENNRCYAFAAQENGTASGVEVITGLSDDEYTEVINDQELKSYKFILGGQNIVDDGTPISIQ